MTPPAYAAGGAAEDTGQAHSNVFSYDASGGKDRRTEKKFTATIKTPQKNNVKRVDESNAWQPVYRLHSSWQENPRIRLKTWGATFLNASPGHCTGGGVCCTDETVSKNGRSRVEVAVRRRGHVTCANASSSVGKNTSKIT